MRRFSVQIIIRSVLIIALSVFLGLIIGNTDLVVNQIIIALLLIALIIEFLFYVRKINQKLTRIFDAIVHSDFTVNFNDDHLGESFMYLNNHLAEVIAKFRSVKLEKEQQFQLLSLLVESIHTGIVAVRTNGEIILFNSAASQLLNISKPNNWSIFHRMSNKIVDDIDAMGEAGSQLVELQVGPETKLITVTISTSTDSISDFRLITIKDIQDEIEQKELEAWHNLIRVLTHEMMNSLTPIASLSETMISMLDQYAQSSKQLNDENISDLQYSLEMIGKRSNSMINFLEEYRRITRVPKPVLEEVDLFFFFEQIKHLTAKEISEEGITLNLEPIKAILYIDQGQIELVFLNLIKNCRQALANTPNPKIIINARKKGNQIIIEVNDNGAGIEPKVQGQIFVPFFTTKEAGSGIGLSLSRQILKLHRAYIHLRQSSSSGTSFELVFPVNNASIIEN